MHQTLRKMANIATPLPLQLEVSEEETPLLYLHFTVIDCRIG